MVTRRRHPNRKVISAWLLSLFTISFFSGLVFSQEEKPAWKNLLDGTGLSGWQARNLKLGNDWQTAAAVALDPQDGKRFLPQTGQGILYNGLKGKTADLVTEEKFGDIELHVEFNIAKSSNSGVYLMGRYEVQIYDSFGRRDVGFIDCGGIYARWVNESNVEGEAPKTNACKAPGEWQTFDVQFRAPRFDAAGKKSVAAKFVKVYHNGVLVHENYELKGPTRSSLEGPESQTGPIMLQGDHGPVAFRNIRVRPLPPEKP